MVDVAVIGGGVVGCCIARELSKYNVDVVVIEKDSDISNGTSKANSGIIHGGYDSRCNTLKGILCAKGNAMFKRLDEQLHFGFNQCGSFVLAFNEKDMNELKNLYVNGKANDIKNLEIVDKDFVLSKEPNINPDVVGALYCSAAGIISPWEFTIAMAENAAINGVNFLLNNEVMSITKEKNYFIVNTNKAQVKSKYIVNAAGLYSDSIAQMVGIDSYQITPRKGEYLLFDKELSGLVHSVIFQTPSKNSKGVLVTPTYHGNIMIGPNAQFIDDKTDVSTTSEGFNEISKAAQKTLRDIDYSKIITQFSGLRASTPGYDFIIKESTVKGFILVGAIDSPGLTSSPAIALMVTDILIDAGLKMNLKQSFNPNLTPIKLLNKLTISEKNKLIKKDSRYGKIICRCESITYGEIIEALHRPIPATTLDSIKRRVRAGSGRCQGGFCSPRVIEIIHQELGISPLKVNKSEKGSSILVEKTKFNQEAR